MTPLIFAAAALCSPADDRAELGADLLEQAWALHEQNRDAEAADMYDRAIVALEEGDQEQLIEALNLAVDQEGKSPAEVAEAFHQQLRRAQ